MYNIINLDSLKMTTPSVSEAETAQSAIADWSSVPSNDQDAVAICYAAGFLGGVDDKGTFAGSSTMDRAQATIVMCALTGADVGGTTTTPDDGKDDETQTGEVTGSKDANGNTTAVSVNNVQNRNKSDKHPTKGNNDTVSNNGYYTGAKVDIGNSVLVCDFLDMVNEARRNAGLNE